MSRSANRLLASLSAPEYRRIAPYLCTIRVAAETRLPHCGTSRVYFPGTGFCSIGSRMSDGRYIEVASVGSEGVVGIGVISCQMASGAAYTHVTPGVIQYMTSMMFADVCEGSELGRSVDRFCGVFLGSLIQLASCSQQHTLQSRCARWILAAHDAVGRARFELSQEFLASATGAAPGALAAVVANLRERALIKHDRDSVTVLDPIGLRRMACDCYGVLKRAVEAAAPQPANDESTLQKAAIVSFRAAACTLCGLSSSRPHKTHLECLRAIDAEMRQHLERMRHLTRARGSIVAESMNKYEKFIKRRRS